MKKNLFVVMLAIVLALCMTSIAVFAAEPPADTDVAKIGNVGYATVNAAIEAATGGQTIEIMDNATVAPFVVNGKKITLNLAGKTLTASGDTDFIKITGAGELTVTGNGKIVQEQSHALFDCSGNSKLTIVNGTYEHNVTMAPIFQQSSGALIIEDGVFTQTGNSYLLKAEGGSNEKTVVTIKGGKFSNTSSAKKELFALNAYGDVNSLDFTIRNATLDNNGSKGMFDPAGKSTYTVFSGKFNEPIPLEHCTDGWMTNPVKGEDGYYTLKKITDDDKSIHLTYTENGQEKIQKYITISQAFEAATTLPQGVENKIITVTKDYKDNSGELKKGIKDVNQFVVEANVTLIFSEMDWWYSLQPVILLNKGTIICNSIDSASSGGGVVDNQGEIFCSFLKLAKAGSTNSGEIHLGQNLSEFLRETVLTDFVNTGIIDANEDSYPTLTIKGTPVMIDNVKCAGSFSRKDGRWVPKGDAAVVNGDTLIIYATLDKALTAIEMGDVTGDTIRLLADIEIDDYITFRRNLVFDLNGKTITVTGTSTDPDYNGFINITNSEVVITGNGTVVYKKVVNKPIGSIIQSKKGSYEGKPTKVIIENGTFITTPGVNCIKLVNGGTCVVKGGTFSSDPTAFLPTGGKEYTTKKEGNTYTVIPPETFEPVIKGASVTLTENVNVNFLVAKGDIKNDKKDYVLFTLGNGTEQKVSVSNLTADEGGNYSFTCSVVAKSMSDNIKVQYYSGGKVIAEKNYSVKDYAKAILAAENPDAQMQKAQTVVKTMLNYGAAAQTYFGYNTSNLANAGIDGLPTVNDHSTDFSTKTIPQIQGGTIPNAAGITNLTAALDLEDTVGIKFYFDTPDGEYTVKVNDQAIIPFMEAGQSCVKISGLQAVDFAKDYTLAITKGGNTTTLTYGVYYYGNQIQGKNESLENLLDAMYDYCEAAKAA